MTPSLRRYTLADYIHELADTHHHTEPYTIREGNEWQGRRHRVTTPALVQQLADNDIPSATVEEGPRAGFASKPAARLDALDTLTWIDRQAEAWVTELGHQRRPGTDALLRQLHSLAVAAPDDTRRAITADVRRWWIRARIVTGWDSAPWTPLNTCPQCGQLGTLRIKLAERVAMCTNEECLVLWDEHSIGLLADHIRVESSADRVPKAGPGPCWCPVPKPIVSDLSRLCAGCGSARCRHAVGARLLDTIRASRRSA